MRTPSRGFTLLELGSTTTVSSFSSNIPGGNIAILLYLFLFFSVFLLMCLLFRFRTFRGYHSPLDGFYWKRQEHCTADIHFLIVPIIFLLRSISLLQNIHSLPTAIILALVSSDMQIAVHDYLPETQNGAE